MALPGVTGAVTLFTICLMMAILVHLTYSPRGGPPSIGPTFTTNIIAPTIIGNRPSAVHVVDGKAPEVLPLCPLRWDEQTFLSWQLQPRNTALIATGSSTQTGSMCATVGQDGCEWLLPSAEVRRLRGLLLDPSETNNAEFLQSRVVSASKPSVNIRSNMENEVATIKVKASSNASLSCTLPHVNPLQCADDTSILFIGHSHTRFLASMHCMMLHGAHCYRYDKHDNDFVLFASDDMKVSQAGTDEEYKRPIRSLYIQANLDASLQLNLVEAAIRNHTQSLTSAGIETRAGKALIVALSNPDSFASLFTHILISKGAWEVLLYDRPANATANELVKSLRAFHNMFPKAKMILHMLHGYIPDPPIHFGKKSKSAKARDAWRTMCFSKQRIEGVRVATLCGLQRFLEETKASPPAIEVFDTVAETLDPFARRYVDALGHHFTDGALEGLVQKLLINHVCPYIEKPEPPSHQETSTRLRKFISSAPSIFPANGKELETIGHVYGVSDSPVCPVVANWTEGFHPTPNCGCLREKHAGNSFCRSMGKHLPSRARLGGQQDLED